MTFRTKFLLFVSICVPPNNPITACGVTSFPGYHSFPKWAIRSATVFNKFWNKNLLNQNFSWHSAKLTKFLSPSATGLLMSTIDFANEWKPLLRRLFWTSFLIEDCCYGIIRSAVLRDLTKALLRMGSVKLVLSVLLFWSKKIYSVCLLVIWIHITTISAANES